MPEGDAFEEWMQKPGEHLHIDLPGGDLLLRHAFEAGARSRDAEVERLREALRELLHVLWDEPSPIYVSRAPRLWDAYQRARAVLGEEG